MINQALTCRETLPVPFSATCSQYEAGRRQRCERRAERSMCVHRCDGWRSTSSRRGRRSPINFAIPRVMPGNAVDAMLAKYPTLDANSLRALEAEFGIAHPRQPAQPVLRLPRATCATATSACRSTQYPAKVTTVLGADAAVDADPGRHRDDHQLRARHAARDPRRLAARRLARPLAAGVHVPAGDAVLLPGADRDRAVLGRAGSLFPFGQGYSLGLPPGFNWTFISSAI